jgi:signal peptidase I
MSIRTPLQMGTAVTAVAAVVAGWLFFAPQQLGGSVSYVITHGNSMEPRFEAGDLVAVRNHENYGVGDVVAYRSRSLDRIVLHRIARREGNAFVTKGDNNEWLDSERPTAPEMIGTEWFAIPGVGKALIWMRSPIAAASIAAITGLGLVGIRRKRKGTVPVRVAIASPLGVVTPVAAAALAGAVAFGALAFLAARAPTRATSRTANYSHAGAFSYSASARPGPAYPTGRVTTGDPLFARLVDDVSFSLAYEFQSSEPHAVSGRASLAARLHDTAGWARTIPLGREAFQGDSVEVMGELNLDRLWRLLIDVQKETGVAGNAYTLSIISTVQIDGTVAGKGISELFGPRLDMQMGLLHAQLPAAQPGAAGDPFHSAEEGSLSVAGSPSQPRLLGLPAGTLRVVGLLGMALSAFAGVWGATRKEDPERIARRYADMVVPVAAIRTDAERVSVADLSALARLAEGYGLPLLRTPDGTYAVVRDGVAYVHTLRATTSPPPPPPPPAIRARPSEARPGRNSIARARAVSEEPKEVP